VTWTDLQGQAGSFSTALTFTETTGITGGTTYEFKVRAHNIYGWGTFSNIASITASSTPAQPAAVTTAIHNNMLRITWTAPTSNYASIDSYRITIQQSDNSFSQ